MEGNQQKMREAASTVYNVLERLKTFSLHIGDIGHKREFNHLVCLAKNRLDAALSEPARQCDVGTAEEQRVRFESFCKRKGDGFSASAYCAYECPCGNKGDCKLAWAQMPYAEEGGAE